MRNKTVIRVKIKEEDTIIWYHRKYFPNRHDAVVACVFHLERLLKEKKEELVKE